MALINLDEFADASKSLAVVGKIVENNFTSEARPIVACRTDPETDTADTSTVNTSTVSVDSTLSESDHDPYFEPVVTLPEVKVQTNEEDEEQLLKLRCKLFRYHVEEENPGIWKERGTGDVKILKRVNKKMLSFHQSIFQEFTDEDEDVEKEGEYFMLPVQEIKVRLLMRQDKTLKIRANHYITPFMELKPNCGSDRAWVWSAPFDFADEEPKKELFAIKFANSDHAKLFKTVFDEGKNCVDTSEEKIKEANEKHGKEEAEEGEAGEETTEKVTEGMGKMNVKDEEVPKEENKE